MRSIGIGIGHDDNFMVIGILRMKVRPHTGTQCVNDGVQLFILFDVGNACLFGVQYLSAQWQNGLIFTVSALLGTASGGISLDQIQLLLAGILALCTCQLS